MLVELFHHRVAHAGVAVEYVGQQTTQIHVVRGIQHVQLLGAELALKLGYRFLELARERHFEFVVDLAPEQFGKLAGKPGDK